MGGSGPDSERRLIAILQLAFSGERAAGLAYNGHWKSLSPGDDRERIRAIEEEEWEHRRQVGEMLATLGAGPDPRRETRAQFIGSILAFGCHVAGWLAPMYGAGKLERRNVGEYELAARLAARSGHDDFVDCLLRMAEVEWEHEAFFRAKVRSHPIGRRLKIWPELPPKGRIREAFAGEADVKGPGIDPGAES